MRRLNRTDRRGATDEKSGLVQGKEAATASEELMEETKQTTQRQAEAPAAPKGGMKRESKTRDAQLPSATRQQADHRANGLVLRERSSRPVRRKCERVDVFRKRVRNGVTQPTCTVSGAVQAEVCLSEPVTIGRPWHCGRPLRYAH